VESIAGAVETQAARARSLEGVQVVVTAGGTREPIDPVRFLGNRSSGRTGFSVADEAARRGAEVVLVTGPSDLPDPFGVRVDRVETARDMRDRVVEASQDADVVVMTAAVADYAPADASASKLKKTDDPLALELVRTPDILAELGGDGSGRILVGYAAETEDAVTHAREKLVRKGADLIVANDVSEPGIGFGTRDNRVAFVTTDDVEELPLLSKEEIAGRLLDRVGEMLGSRGGQ
jgi:phosphopantothenoylcysteine decarboxylase/phosphopantothenate--cysteine ligase